MHDFGAQQRRTTLTLNGGCSLSAVFDSCCRIHSRLLVHEIVKGSKRVCGLELHQPADRSSCICAKPQPEALSTSNR